MDKQYAGLKEHSAQSNRFVKEYLKTALLALMKEKSYKNLTVSELCKKAGVSRMAFYRNYRIINDLFHEAAEDLNWQIVQRIGSPFQGNIGIDWYVSAFNILKEHSEEFSIMHQESFQYEWTRVINNMVLHDLDFTTEMKCQRLMWCGAFENIMAYWFNNNMKETPEEMATYCVKYLPHNQEA